MNKKKCFNCGKQIDKFVVTCKVPNTSLGYCSQKCADMDEVRLSNLIGKFIVELRQRNEIGQ